MKKKKQKPKKVKKDKSQKKQLLNTKKIGTRLILGFGLILLLATGISALNISSLALINDNTEEIIEEDLAVLRVSDQLASDMLERTNLLQAYGLTGNGAYQAMFTDGANVSQSLEGEALDLDESEEMQSLVEQRQEWHELTNEFFSTYGAGNEEEALILLEQQIMPLSNSLVDDFQSLSREREVNMNGRAHEIYGIGDAVFMISLIASIVIVIVGILIAFITNRKISKPLQDLTRRVDVIASGNLSEKTEETNRRDEVGQLTNATHQMAENMRQLLVEIQNVSDTVSTHAQSLTATTDEVTDGAEQITVTMEEIATGAEKQASHASALSTGMNEFVESVGKAEKMGESVAGESNHVRKLSTDGAELMNQSVNQMHNIDEVVKRSVDNVTQLNDQSKQISNIVNVIQDISEQTNLLALNASIEAARAGEHGKGFAVVADEVRKLAEQVGSSVQDITKIISGIQKGSEQVTSDLEDGYAQVKQGTEDIETTGQTFNAIESAIESMAKEATQMTESLSTILTDSQKLSDSVEEIASISQESAAGVEETSASSEEVNSSMEEITTSSNELSGLVKELNELVKRFKL